PLVTPAARLPTACAPLGEAGPGPAGPPSLRWEHGGSDDRDAAGADGEGGTRVAWTRSAWKSGRRGPNAPGRTTAPGPTGSADPTGSAGSAGPTGSAGPVGREGAAGGQATGEHR